MKKAVVILSALLLLASMAVADEKCVDHKGKTGCSETCKLAKGSDACLAKHDSAKTISSEKAITPKPKTGCAETCKLPKSAAGCAIMKVDEKAAVGETKPATCPEHATTAKAVEATAKIENAAVSEKAELVKETADAQAPAPTCGEKTKCVELDQFHAAMHPMALAIGFEGNQKPNMTKFRALYPKMKERTDALAKMPVDDKGMKDPKLFIEKRTELVKLVDELGAACKGTDDSKISPAFEKVHEAYIQLAMSAK